MKKIIFAIILLVSVTSLAQRSRSKGSSSSSSSSSSGMGFNKGDFSISGQFGVTSKKQNDVSTTTFGFQPAAQYFLTNNISLGGTIGFKSTSTSGGGSSLNTFIFGVFGRYYVTPPKQFSLFGQAGFGIESQSGDGQSTTGFNIGLKPGLSYFLNDHFAVEATVGEIGYNSVEKNNEFNFGVDLTSIGIAVLYKF